MKKALLLSGILAWAMNLNAQQRLVLYEEFTSENCGPCAATNPGLSDLINAGDNGNKILMIKYQYIYPSPGPLHSDDATDIDPRGSYYSVPFDPYGRMDGAVSPGAPAGSGNDGHPGYLTQAAIDAEAATAAPFTIDISAYSESGGNINATIDITAGQAISGTNLKLRAALVETRHYATSLGSNGETVFENVVRKMYPGADGQSLSNTWTSGQTQSVTVSGAIPSYVDLTNEHFLVVWIQDDNDKSVKQAARTYPDLDIISQKVTVPNADALHCGVPYNVAPTVTIKNGGTQPLTAATIYYKEAGAAAWHTQSWTGNLALNETTDVPLTGIDLMNTGITGVVDSVAQPNNTTDTWSDNNSSATSVSVLADANGGALPISTDFESNTAAWIPYADAGGYPLYPYSGSGVGYNGSSNFAYYPCYELPSGTQGYLIFPFASLPSGPKALDFYVAYAQLNGSENDKLEVVYSEDCGGSWTSVWSQAGADLKTAPANSQNQFIPSSNGEWKKKSVDVSAIPDGAQIAFRVTSDQGNGMFIDNIALRAGTPDGINELVRDGAFNIYPNPVTDKMTVDLNMVKAAQATFSVVNILGQQLASTPESLNAGHNDVVLSTASLAPGVYFLNIVTEAGVLQRKFVKK